MMGHLGTTERTVKAHRQKVMEKLNARSVAELVSSAERLGMLDSIEYS
jgi:FixJ family two-component response regulator